MAIISIDDAEANFSALISRAEAGEEIILARDGNPVACLVAVLKPKRPIFGALAGRFVAPPDSFFFDPLPDDELRLWEGEGDDNLR